MSPECRLRHESVKGFRSIRTGGRDIDSHDAGVADSASPAGLDELVRAGVRVHELSDFVAVWGAQRASIGWFFGAGISASAGVPTATAVRDRLLCERYAIEHHLVRQELDESDPMILQRVHRYFDGRNGMPPLGSDGDYSAAFELVMPDEAARKRYLEEQFAGARPGFGHRVLGGLLVAGHCDLVITTNFDPLIERGFNDALRRGTVAEPHVDRELNVAGLESSARARVAFQSQRWPLAVKLHGDFRERRLMNTEPELRDQDADLRRFVTDASRTFGIVVCGYSGRDASVMEMFHASAAVPDAWPQGFWWMVRSPESIPDVVRELLLWLASKGVAAQLVIARSFDETMGAIAQHAVVEPEMRRYLDGLRPRGRVVAAAIPRPSSKWPVLRFNALPLVAAHIGVARVVLPAGWRRVDVRAALVPRPKWPVVVCGPGEVLALGDPDDAQSQLASKARRGQDPPCEAGTFMIDPLAAEAAPHHHSLLVQMIAQMLTQSLPVRMQATNSGAARLIVMGPQLGEPSHFEAVRKQLKAVYGEALYGETPAKCGFKHGKRRRFAEEVGLDFDLQAGRAWLLLRPHTWVESPQNPVADRELDPSTPWVNERWALRRRNEFWAELIKVWSELIAPKDRTVLTLASRGGTCKPIARVEMGRINAFSRPNQQGLK